MSFLSDAAIEHLKSVAAWPEFTSDRYLVLEEIGRGGMGVVYAARDTALGRRVALKVVNAVMPDGVTPAAGITLSERLTREARIIAQLEHPGVVPVHDFGVLADGRPFYVMKHVQGRTLHAYVETDQPSLDECLRIFERVGEAVSFAHARGVLHRDLKPSNVMVGDFGEVMVMDWGVAAALKDQREDGTVLGTRGFMSPEQAAGLQGSVDERTDVYALGALLFSLLLRRTPSASVDETRLSLAGAKQVPPPLRSICARALAPVADARYPSVAELVDDVRRFRAGERVNAHRERATERALRVVRKYQVPILLVLAYIVMRVLIAVLAGA